MLVVMLRVLLSPYRPCFLNQKECPTPLCRFLRTVLPHVHQVVVVRKVEVKVLLKEPQRKVEMVILLKEKCIKVGKRS